MCIGHFKQQETAWRHWRDASGTRRQNLGQFGYDNSQLLRFTEEAIAEGYASRSILQGLRHPLNNPYGITRSGLIIETTAYGTIVIGGVYLGHELGENLFEE